jgi:hypothetical protein
MVVSVWRDDDGGYPLAILFFFTKVVYGSVKVLFSKRN